MALVATMPLGVHHWAAGLAGALLVSAALRLAMAVPGTRGASPRSHAAEKKECIRFVDISFDGITRLQLY